MDSNKFIFPIMVFKEGDKNLYSYPARNSFGIVSKGGEKFYKKLTVIDSGGNVFKLKESRILKVAPFFIRLKYMQKMWEMDLSFETFGSVSLAEMKEKVMEHISSNPKHWLALDTLEGIKEQVLATKSLNELFVIFK